MTKIFDYLSQRSKIFHIILAFFLVILIGILDILNGTLTLVILYIIPIALLAWYVSRGAGIQVAFFSSLVWMLSDVFAEKIVQSPIIAFWNTVVKIGLFLIIALALSEIRRNQERNLLMASIVDFSDDAIIGKDLEGKIISWNKGAEKIYGYTSKEVKGKSINLLIPPDRVYELDQLLEKIKKGEQIEHYETLRIRKDGKNITVSLTLSPIMDMHGNLFGVSTFARDISRQKQIEHELKAAEIRYRTLFEESPDGVMIIDPVTTEVLEFNNVACTQLGYTEQEFQGIKIQDFQFEQTPEAIKAQMKLIIQNGRLEFETRHRTKHGQIRNRLVTAQTIELGDNSAILVVHHDITDAKQMELEIRKEKDMLETVTQNMGAGLTIINQEYQTIWSNNVMKQLFGEIHGQHCFIPFYSKPKISSPENKNDNFSENQGEHTSYELKIKDLKGNEIWAQIITTPLKDNEDKIIGGLELVVPITERKKIEEALSKSEEKYRELINTSADGVISIDEQMKIILWNPMAEKIFGYTAEEMLGQDLYRIVPERYRAAKAKGFNEFKATGSGPVLNKTIELYGLKKDQKEVPIELAVSARKTPEGYFANSIVRDISERKRIEEELKYEFTVNSHLAELSATLVSSSPSLEVICNLVLEKAKILTNSEHGYVALIDPITKDLVAYTLTNMMGDRCKVKGANQKIIFPVSQDGLYPALFGYALNERRAFYTDSPHTHPASTGVPQGHLPIDNFLSVPAILGGNLLGQIALANSKTGYSEKDLTSIRRLAIIFALSVQRKKSEEKLRDSEKKYRELIETLQEGIWVIDKNGYTIFVNPKMSEMLGYAIKEMLGKHLFNFMDETEIEICKVALERRQQGISEQHEFEFLRKDGSTIIVSMGTSPILDENGEYQGAIAAAQDITEKKKAEEELKKTMTELSRSNRDLEHFAYIVSHDLQEPLGKITAFGDLLKHHGMGNTDEKTQDYLNRMIGAAVRMKELIDGILNLSRVSTKAQIHENINLNDVVKEVLSDLEIKIKDLKAEIKVDNLPTIKAEPLQMRQLFQNLITNALKFRTPDQLPIIEIASRKINDNLIEITVKDNGIGFEEKYLDRIFKPFQRLHSRQEYEGIGMGLAICQKIVHRHGGDITAQSAPGAGTTFIITLPINQEG